MSFQTRNDSGETTSYRTFNESFEAYQKDPSIWKISFENGDRWVKKTCDDVWNPLSEEKLANMSNTYRISFGQIFWILQKTMADDWKEIALMPNVTEESRRNIEMSHCIMNVLPESEFKTIYST